MDETVTLHCDIVPGTKPKDVHERLTSLSAQVRLLRYWEPENPDEEPLDQDA